MSDLKIGSAGERKRKREREREGAREKERERERYVRTNAPAVVNTSACVIRQRVYMYIYP